MPRAKEFYSALVAEGNDLRRFDYAVDAWQGPPSGTIGWWKSSVPQANAKRSRQAPNDVLLQCFDELAEQSDREEMRYVLALLLVRRRVMRVEEEHRGAEGREVLLLHCPRRDADYEIPVIVPDEAKIEAIQQELAQLGIASCSGRRRKPEGGSDEPLNPRRVQGGPYIDHTGQGSELIVDIVCRWPC